MKKIFLFVPFVTSVVFFVIKTSVGKLMLGYLSGPGSEQGNPHGVDMGSAHWLKEICSGWKVYFTLGAEIPIHNGRVVDPSPIAPHPLVVIM